MYRHCSVFVTLQYAGCIINYKVLMIQDSGCHSYGTVVDDKASSGGVSSFVGAG